MYICSTYNNFTETDVAVFSGEQITAQPTVNLTPAALIHQEHGGMLVCKCLPVTDISCSNNLYSYFVI